ncbi:MAG: sigma-70 family RNA polymerase sigma factor [Planctomycetaceae bacterium]|nr:sigma-70 family RNA polymerase sigma factor [Planctomycetaceae bacterium]
MAETKDFETIALPWLDAVYRAAAALCHDPATAEDLTQATFLKAFENFKGFTVGTSCRAWLTRILRNCWIDLLRHRRVAGEGVCLDEQLVAAAEEPPATTWTDAQDLLENFSDAQVITAMRQLSDDQRLCLFLSDVEGLGQDEVAAVLDVAVGTIKSRTHRARAVLKTKLEAHANELGLGPGKRRCT